MVFGNFAYSINSCHMSFAPGDRVHLPGLGTGVVREIRSGGRLAVEIRGRLIVVHGHALEPVAQDRRSAPSRGARAAAPAPAPSPSSSPSPSASASSSSARATAGTRSLDLHGRTVAEALDDLERFVNEALLEGCAAVRVIHGRSGGKVKTAVHAYLRKLSVVTSVRVDPANVGVTIVTF